MGLEDYGLVFVWTEIADRIAFSVNHIETGTSFSEPPNFSRFFWSAVTWL